MVHMKRIILGMVGGSAVLIPLAGMTVLTAGPVAAKTPKGITCTKLSGSVNLTTGVDKTNLSGCSGKTGGSGKSKGSVSSTSSTLKWVNGKSTTFTETVAGGSGCASGDIAEQISGDVTADSTGSTSDGATVSATICFNTSSGKTSLAPGTNFVFAS
jgi:hypothetical protein